MTGKFKHIASCILVVAALALTACVEDSRVSKAKDIVISEVMASNRTGLQKSDGKTSDWIELKNNSQDSVNLEGFQLAVIKEKPDSVPTDTAVGDVNKKKTWTFPSVTIGAGENLVVFAEKQKKNKKKKKKDLDEDEELENNPDEEETAETVVPNDSLAPGKDLIANFNLPKGGGTIQFLAPNGDVISEMKYGPVAPDQALVRENDSTYVATYWQSPGYDNDRKGYEAFMEKIDEKRDSPLLIWELMSRAKHSYDNWVELKNVSDSDVDISAYTLSKKGGKDEGWKLPERVLKPGEIVTIHLAGKRANENNSLQAPFKLGDAETIVLMKDGKFVDGANAKSTIYGGTMGRMTGQKGFFFFSTPTRNAENGTSGKRYIAELPSFNYKTGIYPKDEKLLLQLRDTTRTVHYTLDGSEPTASSPTLKDTLTINKSTVIRAYAEGDTTTLRSNIGTSTFILGVEHNMPVMNITVNRGDLYNHSNGIYAEGPGYTKEWPHKGANYWKPMTKKAHVELFDNNGNEGFSVDCGLKIFGGFSRAEAKKSFRLKFRGEYGDAKVDYDFFGNGEPMELEDLVLRSGSQDYMRCMIRDEFFTSLMKEQSPTLLTQVYRPVALYVNAEYFGLYYLREKIDKNFVARQLNVPNDSINIVMSIGYNEEGSGVPYKQLMQYVTTHDMGNPEFYQYMKDNVDLQGLIDYKLGEMYSGNTDVGNIRYVRSTSPESDKKWHFVFYDLDASWTGYKPSVDFYLSIGPLNWKANVRPHNMMINKLLANPEFRELFLQSVSHHMKNTFSTQNTTAVFDKLVAQIRPEMKRNCERWPQLSYDRWETNITEFRKLFDDKHKVMLNELRTYLNITDEENKKYFSDLGF